MFVDGLICSTDGRIGGSTTCNTQELNVRLDEWEMRQKTRVVRSGKKQEVCDVVVRDQNVKQVAMMKYPLVQWLVV